MPLRVLESVSPSLQYHCSLQLVFHQLPLPSPANHIQMAMCLISNSCLCLLQPDHRALNCPGQQGQQQARKLSTIGKKKRLQLAKKKYTKTKQISYGAQGPSYEVQP